MTSVLTNQDPSWGCVWCPALEMCSNGVDRRRREWDEETCYLEHLGIRELTMCPMKQRESEEKFYEVTVSHVDGENWMDSFTTEQVQMKHQKSVVWTLPFSFPFFEEKVNILAISERGWINPRADTEKNKVDATYTFIQLSPEFLAERELTVSKGTGFYKESKCGILVYSYDERMTDQIKLTICSDGTINIFFSFPQNHFIDGALGLSHGIYDTGNNVLDHAQAHLDPDVSDPVLNMEKNNTLVTFTPVSRSDTV